MLSIKLRELADGGTLAAGRRTLAAGGRRCCPGCCLFSPSWAARSCCECRVQSRPLVFQDQQCRTSVYGHCQGDHHLGADGALVLLRCEQCTVYPSLCIFFCCYYWYRFSFHFYCSVKLVLSQPTSFPFCFLIPSHPSGGEGSVREQHVVLVASWVKPQQHAPHDICLAQFLVCFSQQKYTWGQWILQLKTSCIDCRTVTPFVMLITQQFICHKKAANYNPLFTSILSWILDHYCSCKSKGPLPFSYHSQENLCTIPLFSPICFDFTIFFQVCGS